MEPALPQRSVAAAKNLSRTAATMVGVLAVVVLVGWLRIFPLPAWLAPGAVTMKANAALALLMASASLVLRRENPADLGRNRVATFLAGVVLMLGVVTLIETAADWDAGIDQLIALDPAGLGAPGRMSPPTALAIAAIGGALVLMRYSGRWQVTAFQSLALIAGVSGLLGLVGFIYGVPEFYRAEGHNPTAMPTALSVLLISLGILLARPTTGLMQAFSTEEMGGRMARRVWLPTVGIALLLDGFIQWGDWRQFYTDSSAEAISAVANLAVVSIAIWVSTRALNRAHASLRHRSRLHAMLGQTNQSIVRTKGREELLIEICRIAVEFGSFCAAVVRLPEAFEPSLVHHGETDLIEPLRELGARARKENRAVILNDLSKPEEMSQLRTRACRGSRAAFSFKLPDGSVGALSVHSAETGFFGMEEIRLLKEVCADLAFALEAMVRDEQRLTAEKNLQESQSRLELASAAANIGFWDWDMTKDRIEFSPEWKRQLGYDETEILNLRGEWMERIHPEDREQMGTRMREYLENKTPVYEAEFRLRHRDGAYRWIYSRAQATRGPDNQPVRMVGWHVDITARKLTEESLRQSEGRLQTVLENMAEGLVISDLAGQVLHWNRAALELHGFDHSRDWMKRLPEFGEVLELSTLEGEVVPFEQWPLSRILRGEKVRSYELRIRRLDVEWNRIFSYGGAVVQDASKYSLAFLTITDVTERTLAEQAVKQSEARFQEIAANSSEVFWLADPKKFAAFYVSPAYEKIWGRSVNEIYQNTLSWMDSVHPADRERVKLAIGNLQQEKDYDETYRIIRPDGSQRWVRDRAVPVRNAEGAVYRFVGTASDVTNAKLAEARSRLQHAVTQILAEGKPLAETTNRILGLVCSSLEWKTGEFWMMDRAADMLRLVATGVGSDVEGGVFEDAGRERTFAPGEGLPGQIWVRAQALWFGALATEPSFLRKGWAQKAGLETAFGFPAMIRESMVGVFVFFGRKISAPDEHLLALAADIGSQLAQFISRERIEEKLRQTQKMEAIGQLAGGVAHDFNNLLTVIKAYPQLMLMNAGLPPESREWLQQISSAADRAAGLTRQLLAFSRKQVMRIQPLNLNEVVEGMGNMLRRIIGEDIALKIELSPGLPRVDADAGMTEQVLMNLVVNARDAMAGGGQLLIATGREKIDATAAAQRPKAREGDFVWLKVRDNGHGMSSETMAHIFEPFFTTKGPDQGTGLGLSTVYGIVEQHRGWIEVESAVGSGAKLTVFLPVAEVRPASGPAEGAKSELQRGHETILLVEDEPAVRMLSRIVLQRLGYKVIDAVSGVAALEIWAQRKNEIDLLITDMVMPHGVNGRDLAEKLRADNPALKILFTTGYSPESVAQGLVLEEGSNFIQKPYVPQVLADAINQCLGRPVRPLT